MSLRRFLLLTVTVQVYGTKGVPVEGTGEADGRTQELKGEVPTQFVLEGSRVVFSLTSPADSGEFRVRAAVGEHVLGSGTSQNPPTRGVRGWVKSSWGGAPPTQWTESFPRDEEEAWKEPPP